MNKHVDSDLLHLLQNSAPPCDLNKIDLFQNHIAKFQNKASFEKSHADTHPSASLQAEEDKLQKAEEPRGSKQSLLAQCLFHLSF